MAVSAIPAGYHSVTPYLIVKSSAEAIAFYKKAFGAKEIMRMPGPGGGIMHAEIKIGDSHLMMSDENLQWGNKGPATLGGTPVGLCIYLPKVDAVFAKAVAAGATVVMPVADQFYGDRSGTVLDPFGHKWTLATHKKDMTPAEMKTAMAEWMKTQKKG